MTRAARARVIAPQMAPIHFELYSEVFRLDGYDFEVVSVDRDRALEYGLRYVNNDMCYPSILVVGELLAAIDSGGYDLDSTAALLVQTGGSCRATNYASLLEKALRDMGLERVPVYALSPTGGAGKATLPVSAKAWRRAVYATLAGDLIMALSNRSRPYEIFGGAVSSCVDEAIDRAKGLLRNPSRRGFASFAEETAGLFRLIRDDSSRLSRIGVVGEIMVKYSPAANNRIVEQIEGQGCEAVVSGLSDFFLYCISNPMWQSGVIVESKSAARLGRLLLSLLRQLRSPLVKALKESGCHVAESASDLAELASPVVSLCNNAGEGWYLVADMRALVRDGVADIACIQPFGCLPNHVVGRGAIKEIKRLDPHANILPLDYDPGISEANQQNRLALLTSVSKARSRAL